MKQTTKNLNQYTVNKDIESESESEVDDEILNNKEFQTNVTVGEC